LIFIDQKKSQFYLPGFIFYMKHCGNK